ncbi:Cell growth regulator with RING finger domain like protein [Argiope bruennichi]|uniref:Cell growth regulator with RING finger domain like protein n=2 Tax=Argiope bruennichi TaxID=94029 RepID=A0A8T0FNA2_ARGBR|nr:Cell growth regulator with RING finger domain like protein [Argiope bruennichi]
MVIILTSILFYVLVSLYSQGLENGGIHYVYTRRVELKMQTIHNPFLFEVNLHGANYSGVQCTFFGEKDYYLLAVWGVPIYQLFELLNSSPEFMKNSITSSSESETFSSICKSSSDLLLVEGGEKKTVVFRPQRGCVDEAEIKSKEEIIRSSYPFVAIMILKDNDNAENTLIAMATAVHLPDDKLKLPAQIIGQHVKSSSGSVSAVKKIFVSSPETSRVDGESVHLCVACCIKTVSAVVMPCGHACVCTTCLERCKNCPVCRGPAYTYFELQSIPVH